MKRRFVFPLLSIVAVIAVFLIALRLYSPRESRSITLYTLGDMVDPAVLRDFTQDTGIGVVLVRPGNETEPHTPSEYDLILTDLPFLEVLDRLGQLTALDPERVSLDGGSTLLYQEAVLGGTHGSALPALWSTMGLLHDSTASGVVVRGWSTLFDPSYPGVIAITGNRLKGLAGALLAQHDSIRTPAPDQLFSAALALRGQRGHPFRYAAFDALGAAFQSGSIALAPCYAAQAIPLMHENPQLSFVTPIEGSWQSVLGYAIPKSCRDPEAAYALLNYLTRPYVMAKNSVWSGWSTPSQEAYLLLSPSWQKNPLAYPKGGLASLKAPPILDYRRWKGFYLWPQA